MILILSFSNYVFVLTLMYQSTCLPILLIFERYLNFSVMTKSQNPDPDPKYWGGGGGGSQIFNFILKWNICSVRRDRPREIPRGMGGGGG